MQLYLYDGLPGTSEIAAVATQLVQDNHVHAIIGMSDTGMVLPAARIAAASKTVFVTNGQPRRSSRRKSWGYLFLSCFSDNEQAAVAAEYLQNDLHATRAWILYDTSMQYTTLLSRFFTGRFRGTTG